MSVVWHTLIIEAYTRETISTLIWANTPTSEVCPAVDKSIKCTLRKPISCKWFFSGLELYLLTQPTMSEDTFGTCTRWMFTGWRHLCKKRFIYYVHRKSDSDDILYFSAIRTKYGLNNRFSIDSCLSWLCK